MENNLEKDFLLDTSAFISLESVKLLGRVVRFFNILTTNAVIEELKEFSKHSDKYGNIAKRVLSYKNKFSIKTSEIKEKIKYLEKTDNELFNLSRKLKIPLVSDDHKIAHHTKDKIEVYFSTFFLVVFVISNIISKKEALQMLEKLRDIRNWQSNIIYLTTKEELNNL